MLLLCRHFKPSSNCTIILSTFSSLSKNAGSSSSFFCKVVPCTYSISM